jgi:hypothetical protein
MSDEHARVGAPLPLRIGPGASTVAAYVLAAAGPPRFSERLSQIERLTAAHRRRLAAASAALADRHEGELLAAARRRLARTWDMSDVNALIESHNRWYPIERALPIDPATGGYLTAGAPYPMESLGSAWVLEAIA